MSVAIVTSVPTAERAEASKAVVRRALRLLFTEGEPRELSELYTSRFRYHEPRMELAGIHGARRICERYLDGFSEAMFEVTSMEATENRVTTHLTLRGPPYRRLRGTPANGAGDRGAVPPRAPHGRRTDRGGLGRPAVELSSSDTSASRGD